MLVSPSAGNSVSFLCSHLHSLASALNKKSSKATLSEVHHVGDPPFHHQIQYPFQSPHQSKQLVALHGHFCLVVFLKSLLSSLNESNHFESPSSSTEHTLSASVFAQELTQVLEKANSSAIVGPLFSDLDPQRLADPRYLVKLTRYLRLPALQSLLLGIQLAASSFPGLKSLGWK